MGTTGAESAMEQQGASCSSPYRNPLLDAPPPPLVLAAPFALTTPLLRGKMLTGGQWESLDQPHAFAQGGNRGGRAWPFPTWVQHKSGWGGVSLQPPACSRWMRAPASITPCSGITTQRQTPAGPSSLGDAEGTATASKPSGNASSGAKPQQVRQPLSPPTILFLQPGVRSKQENPSMIHPPPLPYGAPPGPKKKLEGCLQFARSHCPLIPSSLCSPPAPPRSSWTSPPLGHVYLWNAGGPVGDEEGPCGHQHWVLVVCTLGARSPHALLGLRFAGIWGLVPSET